jgi:polyferredoxin
MSMTQQKLRKLRLTSQILFFALFVFLLLKSEFRGSLKAAHGDIRLPYPVSIFLEADPLAAVANALSSHALYRGLLWSLVILIPTFFLGRFFCGWICPLGSLNHFFGSLKSEKKRGKQRLESNRYHPWQKLKYYILSALLVAALFGSLLAGLMDPIALTVRSVALGVLPGVNYALNSMLDALYGTQVAPFKFAANAIHFLVKDTLLSFKQPYFRQGVILASIFATIMILNLRITRFWCRALCPLGALLGAVSRWSILGLEKRRESCTDCNRCEIDCQGGDDPMPGTPWRKAECHLCFNCVGDCPEAGIRFRFFPERKETVEMPELQRRRLVAGLATGAVLVPILRSTPGFATARDPRLIRPPGALEEDSFLARCIRCGECMKVCPNNALQPTWLEAGLEGMWSPVLVPRIGYCEPTCVLCSQVCPTGAIWEITQSEKLGQLQEGGSGAPIRIGTAFYDRGRCLPWAMARECIVCEEWCPTSPKAIYLLPAEAIDSSGQTHLVRQPYVDPEKCIGCGACEYACPVQNQPAIYVTSIGETRSKVNQFILSRERPKS